MGVKIDQKRVRWDRGRASCLLRGSKVIDPDLIHYKLYLSNKMWCMFDLHVNIHMIIIEDKNI